MADGLRARTRDWFERVWNQRDEAAIPGFAHPHIKCYGLDEQGHTWTGFDASSGFAERF